MNIITLKHNQHIISAPLKEKVRVYILLNRYEDGSMDIIFEGVGVGVKNVWYYQQVIPGDEIVVSRSTGDIDYPEIFAEYEQISEFHYYSMLNNILETKKVLYNEIPKLGVELITNIGNFSGFVYNRVVVLTIVYCRDEVDVQFGALDTKTFDMFTWCYQRMNENESLIIRVTKIVSDSEHLAEFPSKMSIIPTTEELSDTRTDRRAQLQQYKLKYAADVSKNEK